ncbi:urease accessory protein UreF [Collinsella sp. AGMB00827]|uniref:Urease accessory protein UreF n=1 Tax=Collinsella ureilytica TaxID=2869515 RepID=A0ABS7MHN3_9ACTN|nr:urease accessory protein UreF [Collinsella urealyticum]MBY4796860.1 urease accessory protein UreF [Collinsella urealyticum]
MVQLLDSAFPTGAFAHTFGLETYFQDRRVHDAKTLKEVCTSYIVDGVADADAILVGEAHRAAAAGELDHLIELDQLCHAMKLSLEVRDASSMQGRQFLRSIRAICSDELLVAWRDLVREKEVRCHYPIVFGMYAALIGAPAEAAILAFLYATTGSLVLNAVRGVPLGQLAGVEVVHEMLPVLSAAAKRAQACGVDDLATRCVGVEIASMRHERLHSRLFIS